jgi:8-oxo-dGTP diphosphatase
MKHRIRAAAIIVDNHRILLVQHVDPATGEEFWVPPGGGVEDHDNSIFETARRETFEETGLRIDIDRLIYYREFHDRATDTLHLELFFLATRFSGELTISNVHGSGPDEHWIRDVRWLARDEIATITVYPHTLAGDFWSDLENRFPAVRYLDRQLG